MTPSVRSKFCLLVVDDEPEICDSVYHLLRRQYDVLRATSAAAAVEMLAQHEVHVIMTDQRMPEVTGTEMLKRVKTEYPEAIRMLFTGYADVRSVIDAINQGHVYRYLSKPFSSEELEAAVADAAAEYDRIARRGLALTHCLAEVERLEREMTEMRTRVSRLEEDNVRLVEKLRGV